MKLLSNLSIIRGIGYLLVFILCVNCKKEYTTTDPSNLSPDLTSKASSDNLVALGLASSQTKTAGRFNDWPPRTFVDAYPQGEADHVAFDDNSYAYTKRLNSRNWYASLVLQGFGFTVPSDATIDNIIVSVRRFKKGNPSIRDYFANLVKEWSFQEITVSDGQIRITILIQKQQLFIPKAEWVAMVASGNQFYQWTPAMINDPDFGVRIDVYPPVGVGSVVVYYDLVEITVEYSLP